jgi:hypothetical protein
VTVAETDEFGELRRVEGSGGPPDEFGRLEPVEGRAAINPGSEPFVFTPLEPMSGRPGGSPELVAATPRRVGAVGALLAVGFMSTLAALLLVVNRALPPAVLETPYSLPSAAEVPEVNAVGEPSSEGSFEPVPEPPLGPGVRTGTVAVGPTSSPAGTPTSGSDQGNLPRDEDRAVKDDRGGNDGGRGGGGGDGDGDGDGGTGGGGGDGDGDGGTGGGGGDGDGDGGTGGGGGDGGGGEVPKSRTHHPGKAKGHDKDHDKGRGHNGSPGHENGHGHGKGKAKGHEKDHAGGGSSNGGGGSGRGGGGSPGEAGKGHAKGRGNAGGQGKGRGRG